MRRITLDCCISVRWAAALCCLSLFSWALTGDDSHAAIMYGDFSANTVDYLDVTEDTNTGDTLPLFGAPTVSGDSLDFDPVGFSANSSGGGPPDMTDGQLTFMIQAKNGNVINSLFFSEAGDTSLARSLNSLDDALTTVTASIFVDILEVDNVALIVPINIVGAMTFTPSGGDYLLSVDGLGNASYQTEWTGSYFLDLLPELVANNITGDVTKVSVNLDNVLMASSSTNSTAFIAKKDFDGVTITTNPEENRIPEPSTALLALGGLLVAATGRRLRG